MGYDIVIGKRHGRALVTSVERVTEYTVSTQVNSKNAADVIVATVAFFRSFKDVVQTITTGNEKEF